MRRVRSAPNLNGLTANGTISVAPSSSVLPASAPVERTQLKLLRARMRCNMFSPYTKPRNRDVAAAAWTMPSLPVTDLLSDFATKAPEVVMETSGKGLLAAECFMNFAAPSGQQTAGIDPHAPGAPPLADAGPPTSASMLEALVSHTADGAAGEQAGGAAASAPQPTDLDTAVCLATPSHETVAGGRGWGEALSTHLRRLTMEQQMQTQVRYMRELAGVTREGSVGFYRGPLHEAVCSAYEDLLVAGGDGRLTHQQRRQRRLLMQLCGDCSEADREDAVKENLRNNSSHGTADGPGQGGSQGLVLAQAVRQARDEASRLAANRNNDFPSCCPETVRKLQLLSDWGESKNRSSLVSKDSEQRSAPPAWLAFPRLQLPAPVVVHMDFHGGTDSYADGNIPRSYSDSSLLVAAAVRSSLDEYFDDLHD